MLLSTIMNQMATAFHCNDVIINANPVKPGVKSTTSSIDVIDTTPNSIITTKLVETVTAQSSAPITINIVNMPSNLSIQDDSATELVPVATHQTVSESPILDAVINEIAGATRTVEEELAEDVPVGEDVPAISMHTDAYGPISANIEMPDELRIASMNKMQRTPDLIQLGPNMAIPRNLMVNINDPVEDTMPTAGTGHDTHVPQLDIRINDNTVIPSVINPHFFEQPQQTFMVPPVQQYPEQMYVVPSTPQYYPGQEYAAPIVPQIAPPAAPEYVDIKLDVIPRDLPRPAASIDRVPAAPPIEPDPPAAARIDNSAIIQKYPYLEVIEQIALKTQQQIHFYDIPRNGSTTEMSGIIKADVYFSNGTINQYKGFYIDTGMLYDSRVKVFPAVDGIKVFEMAPCYVLKSTDKDTKKEIFNTKMIEELLTGGYQAITEKELYYDNWKELNRFVALISMPTKRMNGESRKATQNVLKALHSAGVLEEARNLAPNTRLIFSSAYKNPNDFVLTNVNLQTGQWVPEFFGYAATPSVPLEIHVEGKKATIMTLGPDIDGIRKTFDIDTRAYRDTNRSQKR